MKIKVNFKSLMLLACFTALSSFAFAQKTISGLVTDGDSKEPLVGAAVVVTGTTKGTLTDVDGRYTLTDIPANTTTLTFSFTGYSNLTVPIGSGNVLDAELKGGTILESVVVVGYGSVKQKESTSSVASLKAADFNTGNISSVSQLLQGKIAGLVVATPAGGNPNAVAQIRLRGISTFGANSSPLIIVDGVPNVPLNLVDPNDIESFDVLRDGSAAAIYGVQASSGVIIVTTKKGASGKTTVNYGVQLSSESLATTPQMMSAAQYLEANKAAGNALADVDKGGVTDWYKEITRSALSNVHNLSLSGGLGKGGYSASLNWRNQQGVAYDGYKQLNARLNLNQRTLNDRLNLNFNFATTNQDQVFAQDGALEQASKYIPTAPVRYKDQASADARKYGGYFQNVGGFDQYNPKAIQDQLSNNSNKKRYTLSTRADLDIIKDLKWTSTYALTREDELNSQFVSRNSFFGAGADRNGIATRNAFDKSVNFFNSYLNYNKDLGQSSVSLTGGYEYQRTTEEGFGIQAAGFLTDVVGTNSIGSASDFSKEGRIGGGSGRSGERLISFFGRANFNYNDIASLSAVVRRDGSSKFADGKQWGIFPAVSAALYLNKILNLTTFDQLKLKVGYGVTGALPIQRYESRAGYVIGRDSSINSQRNASENLTWEKKGELNIGLDFLALDSRLSGSFDFFNRNITDLLYRYNVPPGIFEYPTLLVNAGELNTKGFDFNIAYDILRAKDKGLNWKSSLVLSNFSTKLISLTTADKLLSIGGRFATANAGSPGQNSTPYSLVEEGTALGNFWGFQYVRADAKDGILIKNVKGETVKIEAGTDADKVILGNGLPKYIVGLTNTFNYGNLDFTFFLRGVFGHKIVNEYRVFYENANGGSLKSYNRVNTKYWDANIKDGAYNSYHVEKGDFLRLDNFTLGYNLPLPSNGTFNKVRVFLSGNNVATFTGYTGINPEVRFIDGNVDDGTGNPFAPGIERRSNYFTTRSFTIGANFGF
jgi:TonB-dependent starch-binding outer membrane protein SusC